MRKEFVFMQDNVLCNNSKSAIHIHDIRRTPVFECPGDSLDLNPKEEDWNIMKRSYKRWSNNKKPLCERFITLLYSLLRKQIIKM